MELCVGDFTRNKKAVHYLMCTALVLFCSAELLHQHINDMDDDVFHRMDSCDDDLIAYVVHGNLLSR